MEMMYMNLKIDLSKKLHEYNEANDLVNIAGEVDKYFNCIDSIFAKKDQIREKDPFDPKVCRTFSSIFQTETYFELF